MALLSSTCRLQTLMKKRRRTRSCHDSIGKPLPGKQIGFGCLLKLRVRSDRRILPLFHQNRQF